MQLTLFTPEWFPARLSDLGSRTDTDTPTPTHLLRQNRTFTPSAGDA